MGEVTQVQPERRGTTDGTMPLKPEAARERTQISDSQSLSQNEKRNDADKRIHPLAKQQLDKVDKSHPLQWPMEDPARVDFSARIFDPWALEMLLGATVNEKDCLYGQPASNKARLLTTLIATEPDGRTGSLPAEHAEH